MTAADGLFIDLEDALPPKEREPTRHTAVKAATEGNWTGKVVAIRVNEVDSEWGLDDLTAVAQIPSLDMIIVPKVEEAEDLRFISRILSASERRTDRPRPLGIIAAIETPKGISNVDEIARSSERLLGLIFGTGDYSISLGSPVPVIGQPDPHYCIIQRIDGDDGGTPVVLDRFHYPMARISNACHANGILALDGPYTDFGDDAGLRASCGRARALGFKGKCVIHPKQASIANSAFSPTDSELEWARRIVSELRQVEIKGRGTSQLGNVMLDQAHIRLANSIMRDAEEV